MRKLSSNLWFIMCFCLISVHLFLLSWKWAADPLLSSRHCPWWCMGTADIIQVSFRTGQLCATWVMAPDWQASAKTTTARLNYEHFMTTQTAHTRPALLIFAAGQKLEIRNVNLSWPGSIWREFRSWGPDEESWPGLCGHGQCSRGGRHCMHAPRTCMCGCGSGRRAVWCRKWCRPARNLK